METKPTTDEPGVDTRISRREILKYGSAITTLSAATGTASAGKSDTEDHIERSRRLVEIKISAEVDEPEQGQFPSQTSDVFLPTFYSDGDRAFVVSSQANDLLRSQTLISSPYEVLGISAESAKIELPFMLDGGYNGFASETYEPIEESSGHEFQVSVGEDGTRVEKGSGETMHIQRNEEKSEYLEERKTRTAIFERQKIDNPRERGEETVSRNVKVDESSTSVQPTITVRDNGTLPVHSINHGYIFPESMPTAGVHINKIKRSDQARVNKIGSGIHTATGGGNQ